MLEKVSCFQRRVGKRTRYNTTIVDLEVPYLLSDEITQLSNWLVEWESGMEFNAAVILDTSMQSRIAEKEGVTSVYTVTTRRSTPLSFHDVFRREKDGGIFRVTSNGADKQSPEFGTLDICQVTAERWELTK